MWVQLSWFMRYVWMALNFYSTAKTFNSLIAPFRSCRNASLPSKRCVHLQHLPPVETCTSYVWQRLNGIAAPLREPQGPEDTPEKPEAERGTSLITVGLRTSSCSAIINLRFISSSQTFDGRRARSGSLSLWCSLGTGTGQDQHLLLQVARKVDEPNHMTWLVDPCHWVLWC